MMQNVYLCMIFTSQIFITRPDTDLGLNKQLINLRYNDMKNLTLILYHCIGPKCVPSTNDTKALFLCDNRFVFERNIL